MRANIAFAVGQVGRLASKVNGKNTSVTVRSINGAKDNITQHVQRLGKLQSDKGLVSVGYMFAGMCYTHVGKRGTDASS